MARASDKNTEIDSYDSEARHASREADDRALLRKIDLHLLPILTLLYLLSFLDRANIGNAKLDGLTTDIHVVGANYNTSLAFAAYWIVPNWPERASFLTQEERTRLLERSKYDSAGVTEEFQWRYVRQALGDHLVWGYALLFHGYAIGVAAWLASILNRRAILIAGAAVIGIIGYILLLATHSAGRQYVGVHLACAGVYVGNALLLSWPGETVVLNPSQNVASQTKRAVAVALQISIGDLGAIAGVLVYRPEWAGHKFRKPHIISIGYLCFALLVTLYLWLWMSKENSRRQALLEQNEKHDEQDDSDERVEQGDRHKAHHPAQSGAKAEKKAKRKTREHGKGYNEKAFAPRSGRNADRQGRRAAEKDQTRLHVPLVNRTPDDEPPPVIVAMVGPPGVGKTTLVKSLVKRYTKHTLSEVKGPITVVAGKKRRLTFVECNNDLNSMIDIGKIADLVLLMIDGSFGFEMETFEFLNILQSHGFPKRETKKQLKKRFWSEIYQGAKLFYLSGVLNGRYPDTEIQNLSRFISVMKFRPLVFRNSHPYLLADRIQDMTSKELVRQQPTVDRTVTLYGYLRGTNLRETTKVHVPGAGDLTIKTVTKLADPCPLPTADSEKRRKLSEKQKLIHAPMSDAASRDRGQTVRLSGEGERMVMDLQDATSTLAEKLSQSHIRLFDNSSALLKVDDTELDSEKNSDYDESENETDQEDSENEEGELLGESDRESDVDSAALGSTSKGDRGRTVPRNPRLPSELPSHGLGSQGGVEYAESDSDMGEDEFGQSEADHDRGADSELGSEGEGWNGGGSEDEDEDAPQWKSDLSARASRSFSKSSRRKDWTKLVYASECTAHEVVFGQGLRSIDPAQETVDDGDDELFKIKRPAGSTLETFDQDKEPIDIRAVAIWEDEDMLDSIRHLFITGEHKVTDTTADGEPYEHDADGGFEDLEALPNGTPSTKLEGDLAAKKALLKRKFDEQYDDPDDDPTAGMDFYDQEKDKLARQLQLNQAELEGMDEETRTLVEGHRAGTYVRVELENVPCELIENFDPAFPIIVGGLLPAEERVGFVQVRLKRHRWYTRTLKTNDPLIFSIGWRRFQTLPIYSLDDHSIRMRMLKYTPEHMHCYATFYGPVSLPGTGFCAFNSLEGSTPGFRVSASGVVLDIDRSVKIVKKLKLTGVPYKIFKNTAFVKDMFNSALEVAKFEGANIRTVSGIRGQIKKAQAKPDGAFRATFEDKVLMSDIIFLRAWYSIMPRKFYNPVTSLLLADKSRWQGMRLTGQVRRTENIKTPLNVNSTYKAVDRPSRRFNPLKIPKKLQAELPYASKIKTTRPQNHPTYMQKRAIVLEPEEKKALSVIQQIRAVRKDQVARRREKQNERKAGHRRKVEAAEAKKTDKRREERKEYMRIAGQKVKRASQDSAERSSKRRRQG
ncbi:40S ribosome biogenesis protein Tsr1 and BMS1 C-terminal [Ceratobasidium sp. AG-Ba]|nr:40S ribosome biogenesis protein Tsr1 and BMS1 C-terminal [Ceratobasidium sp. AG-Ba]QRW06306.1 40S ribosome biogenesis protein Tsr1 and BMS1 C-terminal [Ceratobasidium sp. AG-Ba]